MGQRLQRLRLRAKYAGRIVRAEMLRMLLRASFALSRSTRRVPRPEQCGRKRILLIVIGGLGDCLLFQPLLRRLKEEWPGARVDVVTGAFEDMWDRIGFVDNVFYFTPGRFKMPWHYARFFNLIRRNSYDIVAEGIAMIPMRGIYPMLTSLVFEAGRAPIRIGRTNVGRRETLWPSRGPGFAAGPSRISRSSDPAPSNGGYGFPTHFITICPPQHRQYHESSQIFKPLGLACERRADEPRIAPDPDCNEWARRTLRGEGAGKDDIVVGCTIEANHPLKQWPEKCFADVIERAVGSGMKFVITGLRPISSDSPVARFDKADLLDLSGKTTLGHLMAVIDNCDVFLSADCGPAHLAQACRVPTIVLFGPSNEREFGPVDRVRHTLILPPADLDCRPCVLGPCVRDRSCIGLIRPEMVYNALRDKAESVRLGIYRREPDNDARAAPRTICRI